MHSAFWAWGADLGWLGMAHGDGHRHEHAHLDEMRERWLDARRAYRVALRVHLEEEHAWAGRGDPERVHRQLHERQSPERGL